MGRESGQGGLKGAVSKRTREKEYGALRDNGALKAAHVCGGMRAPGGRASGRRVGGQAGAGWARRHRNIPVA